MGDGDNHWLINDEEGLTKSDLRWIRESQKIITPEALEWLKNTRTVLTADRLSRWSKHDEQQTAAWLVLALIGSVLGALGIDKIVKLGKAALEILGGAK